MVEWLQTGLQYWRACQALGIVLAAACFAIWFYFWRSRALLRGMLAATTTFVKKLPETLRGSPAAPQDRYGAFLHRLLARMLADMRAGSALTAAFDTRVDLVMTRVRRDLVVLAALTTAAPLLGLLGTVLGMIDTFRAVGGGGVTERMAGGISQALITTQFGLVIAIPGLFGMARLNRLLMHLQAQLAMCRTRLTIAWEQPTEAR
jgi:biopolymer transport protein ExbB